MAAADLAAYSLTIAWTPGQGIHLVATCSCGWQVERVRTQTIALDWDEHMLDNRDLHTLAGRST